MRKRAGARHLVNVVSVAGKQAHAGGSTYSASKFGLKGWTEAVALELAEEGIRVVAVCPGYVNTDLVDGMAEAERMIQPDDLARVILDWTFLPPSVHVDELTVWPWEMYTE
jgi:NAD(P)-dependent dehydrogenase (short-subunit alcohol dehydrogenase family)